MISIINFIGLRKVNNNINMIAPHKVIEERKRRKDKYYKIISLIVFFCLWQGVSYENSINAWFNPVFLPSPADVIMTGYHPIVAHVERYVCTVKDWDYIYELKRMGADIQINADSVTGDNGWAVQRCTKALLKDHIVDYIASDAHDLKSRTPQLSKCYKYVVKKYGVEYADKIMKADVTKKFG